MKVIKNNLLIKLFSILIGVTITSFEISAQVEIDKSLPAIYLINENGGNINGSGWSSKELDGKINLVLYVAPDQQSSVQQFLNKIDKQGYRVEEFQVTLILNTEATWIPNSIIERKVKSKAEEDSTKIYVLDKNEIVLHRWKLSEANPNLLLVNKKGKVVFLYMEELTEEFENNIINEIELQIKEGVLK